MYVGVYHTCVSVQYKCRTTLKKECPSFVHEHRILSSEYTLPVIMYSGAA